MTLDQIFDDAHRRVCIAKHDPARKDDRTKIWTGLAMPSEIKPAVKLGLMEPVHGETPRILNWYKFTELGWKEYDLRYEGKPDWFDD